MSLTIEKEITERIQKLQQLLALTKDPEADAILRKYYGANGNPPWASAGPSKLPKPSDTPAPTERGQLKKMVLEVLQANIQPMTTTEISQVMEANGFIFNSQRPFVAVNEALNGWAAEGLAKIDHTEGRTNFWLAIPVQGTNQ
jgi:hypothetical protein